ncbi:MAG: NAD(P)/FAD-dependent oxidoreductase [Spirochaetes bacterium]|nr:NAD(P)/FAD-dependent oxidoreductase [Spirochaetota bacterium]
MDNRWNREYDAVVVGAGNGGMTASTQLALLGKRVLLLEQHNIIGGFSTSFVRGRFEFEASLHELCDVGSSEDPGGVGELFKELGVEVEWMSVPEAYRLIVPEKNLNVVMPFGVSEYIDAMERYVPGSRPAVTKFMDLADEVMRALQYLAESKGNPDRKVLMGEYGNFMRTTAYSLDQVCDAVGVPKAARDILYAYWCYLGVPTSRLNFTIFAAMINRYLIKGAYIPRYRSTEMALAFERRFRELGGTIECGTRVEKILVEKGSVTGIVTASGERIKTGHVLCNASLPRVYGEMVHPESEVPEMALRSMNARSVAGSGFVVFLGLDASPDELGLKDYSYFIYHDTDTDALYDGLYRLGRPTVQAAVCLNRAVPDCSPPGTTIMSITCLYKPEAWKDVEPKDYFKLKNELAGYFIDDFEAATGCSIRGHIEEIDIAAPPTYARYTGAYQGVIYGYEVDSWDSLMPRMMMMKDDIYIKGLRFASGWGFRCIGYSSALQCGRTEALLTSLDMDQEKGGAAS